MNSQGYALWYLNQNQIKYKQPFPHSQFEHRPKNSSTSAWDSPGNMLAGFEGL